LLLLGLLAGACVPLWRPLARRAGRPRAALLLMCLSTAVCFALTLPQTIGAGSAGRLMTCVEDPAPRMAGAMAAFGRRGLEDVMNVALWVPPGFFGVLATGRAVMTTAVLSVSFAAVEVLQTLDPGRECDPGDCAYNTSGLVAGAVAAVAWRAAGGLSRGRCR
jgi:hypothetical protein